MKNTPRSLELQRQREHKAAALEYAAENGIRVISKQEAKALGLTKYFTVKMCPKAHLSERYVSKSRCIACLNDQVETWREKNREAYSANRVRRRRERCETDPDFALRVNTRALIGNALRRNGFKKGSSAEALLGCSWDEFKVHLERQFLTGMSWENWSEWEVDHITPIASATTREQILALNHMTNLRPLWKLDNRKKSSSIEYLI